MRTSHGYDANGRELRLLTTDAAGVALQRYTATYDQLGNRLTVRELDGTRVTYQYDTAYQLVREMRDGTYTYNTIYAYDAVGNRQSKRDNLAAQLLTSTYNAANELTGQLAFGGARTTFAYDGNGNTLSEEDAMGAVTAYSWDYENRMLGQVEPDGSRYTYTYRQDSRRVVNETPDGAKRILLWDKLNCLQELDGGLALIAQYTDYPGQWGGLASQRRGADSSYYGFDLQWTGRVLVAQSQVVSDSYVNDAWGVELGTTGGTVNVYRFAGQLGARQDTQIRLDLGLLQTITTLGRWLCRNTQPENPSLNSYVFHPLSFGSTIYMTKPGTSSGSLAMGFKAPKPKPPCGCDPKVQDRARKMTCAQLCAHVIATAGNPNTGGFVGCFGCRKCACVGGIPGVFVPNQCHGLDDCIISHETKHIPVARCFGCEPSTGGMLDPIKHRAEECRHIASDLRCLAAAIATATMACAATIKAIQGAKTQQYLGYNCAKVLHKH